MTRNDLRQRLREAFNDSLSDEYPFCFYRDSLTDLLEDLGERTEFDT